MGEAAVGGMSVPVAQYPIHHPGSVKGPRRRDVGVGHMIPNSAEKDGSGGGRRHTEHYEGGGGVPGRSVSGTGIHAAYGRAMRIGNKPRKLAQTSLHSPTIVAVKIAFVPYRQA